MWNTFSFKTCKTVISQILCAELSLQYKKKGHLGVVSFAFFRGNTRGVPLLPRRSYLSPGCLPRTLLDTFNSTSTRLHWQREHAWGMTILPNCWNETIKLKNKKTQNKTNEKRLGCDNAHSRQTLCMFGLTESPKSSSTEWFHLWVTHLPVTVTSLPVFLWWFFRTTLWNGTKAHTAEWSPSSLY